MQLEDLRCCLLHQSAASQGASHCSDDEPEASSHSPLSSCSACLVLYRKDHTSVRVSGSPSPYLLSLSLGTLQYFAPQHFLWSYFPSDHSDKAPIFALLQLLSPHCWPNWPLLPMVTHPLSSSWYIPKATRHVPIPPWDFSILSTSKAADFHNR